YSENAGASAARPGFLKARIPYATRWRTGAADFDVLARECWRRNPDTRAPQKGTAMADASGLMRGKRGLIMGVANNRSIAWGIARACRNHGADLAFTYQGDALKKRVEPLAEEVDGIVAGHCDVSDPMTINAVFEAVRSAWGSLDFVVHAIAFSDKDQ